MTLLPFPQVHAEHAATPLPRAPQTPEDTGLPHTFLVELVGKAMYQLGFARLMELSQHLCLAGTVVEAVCHFMRREGLLEVLRRGQHDGDVQFELTQAGHARAADWLVRNQYVGPAPVSLEAYRAGVLTQSLAAQPVDARRVHEAFADLVVSDELKDRLGTAINSGRPLLLYGPSGSGKTYLASHLRRLMDGRVAVPHAIYVHGEVVRVFDEHCHQPASDAPDSHHGLDNRERADARWVLCQRPCVVAGGELTLEMLDLSFDARAGYYEAPPHFKANNGLFIVDDLGRQVITPRALMNRWIVPMERRHDYLMLRNGGKFMVPFDLALVFSTNLHPRELDDAAFLRRLGHKIRIGPVPLADYRRIFERAAATEDVPFDSEAFDALLHRHAQERRALLACLPQDLLHLITSRATYLGVRPQMSPELLDWAWLAYFGSAVPLEHNPQE